MFDLKYKLSLLEVKISFTVQSNSVSLTIVCDKIIISLWNHPQ